jgi:hypothetical protein
VSQRAVISSMSTGTAGDVILDLRRNLTLNN